MTLTKGHFGAFAAGFFAAVLLLLTIWFGAWLGVQGAKWQGQREYDQYKLGIVAGKMEAERSEKGEP